MEIIFLLPIIYQDDLPLEQICDIMLALYEDHQFIYLARLIRKYHSYLPQSTIMNGFTILAKIVASPLSDSIAP